MAVSMFGIPNVPVAAARNPSWVQYPKASKILVSYPDFDGWRQVYDPGNLFTRFNDQRYSPAAHQMMRRAHEYALLRQLNIIFGSATGKAVLHQLNIGPPWNVMIYPFELSPLSSFQASQRQHRSPMPPVTTSSIRDPTRAVTETALPGVQICGKRSDGSLFCEKETGTGKGSEVEMYFTPLRIAGPIFCPDDTLLHELVHAVRVLHGKLHHRLVSGSYGNQEEFVAVLVQNIYRSERGRLPYDYKGFLIDEAKFLTPEAREIIGELKLHQSSFFDALADVKTRFNPVQQFRSGK